MKITKQNCKIKKDGKYFRVIIEMMTHTLHSEMLNLDTAVDVRDKLVIDV
jgi:hypothetical protein